MLKKHIWVFLISVVIVAGCATVPTQDIEVQSEVDPKARFSGYKTYAWLGAAAIVNDPYGQWEPPEFDADAEITFLIDRELRRRGLLQSDVEPDMVVAYAAGIDMDALKLKTDPATKMEIVQQVPRGGLIVVLTDAQTGFVMWAGLATADIQEHPNSNTVRARMDYAVSQMFKLLPR